MRKAFTLIELMICIAIAAIIVAIIVNAQDTVFTSGKTVMWQGQKVYIIAYDIRTSPTTFLIRLSDNREMRVTKNELSLIVNAERN